jgi:hypothetical protein
MQLEPQNKGDVKVKLELRVLGATANPKGSVGTYDRHP